MKKIKISIITPCYNVEKYIVECLDSIISQSLNEIEILCFDDGSTDDTLAVLNSYQKKDSRIIVIEQKNSGPSIARNKGLAMARGEYISFVDSDDILASDALKKCYEMACEYNADMVHFNAKVVFEDQELETQFRSRFMEQYNIDFDQNTYIRSDYGKYNNKEAPISGPTFFSIMQENGDYRVPIWLCLFRTAFINKHQLHFIEGIYHAYDDFSFKAYLSSESIVFYEANLYCRRLRRDSIMTTPVGRWNTISRIIGQENMLKFLKKISQKLSDTELDVAKNFLINRRKMIEDVFLKYLSDDETDTRYKKVLDSLDESRIRKSKLKKFLTEI